MFRAEADIFDLARQRRRSGSYYGADTDPVSQRQQAEFAPSTSPVVTLWRGDCLKFMSEIPDTSTDLLLTDPPFGSGELPWDQPLDLPVMWAEFRRIMKPHRPMIQFATQPFASRLVLSAEKAFGTQMLKVEFIWAKGRSADFVLANDRPLRFHENI